MSLTSHFYCRSTTDASVAAIRAFTKSTITSIRETNKALSGRDLGWLLSMCQGDEELKDIFGDNLARLRKVKAKYDPNGIWRKGVVITPNIEA